MDTPRTATPEDVAGVVRLEQLLFGADAWSETGVCAELAAPGRRFVVVADPAPVGYAVSSTTGEVADLLRIGVHPDRRRAGLATALLDDLLAHTDAERMLLEVGDTNVAAVAFYTRHGFTVIDRRARYYRDGSDALVLARDLTRTTMAP